MEERILVPTTDTACFRNVYQSRFHPQSPPFPYPHDFPDQDVVDHSAPAADVADDAVVGGLPLCPAISIVSGDDAVVGGLPTTSFLYPFPCPDSRNVSALVEGRLLSEYRL